jgi:hypothetical protein
MTTVRSGATGRIIPCCWAECDKPGHAEYEIRIHEGAGRVVHYLFCSSRHRLFYAYGPTDYGQLPAGMATTDGHVRVPAQRWKGQQA